MPRFSLLFRASTLLMDAVTHSPPRFFIPTRSFTAGAMRCSSTNESFKGDGQALIDVGTSFVELSHIVRELEVVTKDHAKQLESYKAQYTEDEVEGQLTLKARTDSMHSSMESLKEKIVGFETKVPGFATQATLLQTAVSQLNDKVEE